VGDSNDLQTLTTDLVRSAKDAAGVWQKIAAGGTSGAMVVGALVLVAIFGIQQGEIGFSTRDLNSGEFVAGVIAGTLLVLAGLIGAIKQRIALNQLQFTAYEKQLEQVAARQARTEETITALAKGQPSPSPPEARHEK
jgi:hypothetical protein